MSLAQNRPNVWGLYRPEGNARKTAAAALARRDPQVCVHCPRTDVTVGHIVPFALNCLSALPESDLILIGYSAEVARAIRRPDGYLPAQIWRAAVVRTDPAYCRGFTTTADSLVRYNAFVDLAGLEWECQYHNQAARTEVPVDAVARLIRARERTLDLVSRSDSKWHRYGQY